MNHPQHRAVDRAAHWLFPCRSLGCETPARLTPGLARFCSHRKRGAFHPNTPCPHSPSTKITCSCCRRFAAGWSTGASETLSTAAATSCTLPPPKPEPLLLGGACGPWPSLLLLPLLGVPGGALPCGCADKLCSAGCCCCCSAWCCGCCACCCADGSACLLSKLSSSTILPRTGCCCCW